MSQYDCSIHYISINDNCITDALLQLPDTVDKETNVIASILEIKTDVSLVQEIKEGYQTDPWCKALAHDLAQGFTNNKLCISSQNGLIFIGNRLIIPKHREL